MDLSKVLAAGIPGIPSDYIPHDPTPKQTAYLFLPHREAFYGGAAGGGKGGRCWTTPAALRIIGKSQASPGEILKLKETEMQVLTPKGYVAISDVKVGDIVCHPNGTQQTIVATHDHDKVQYYEVEFEDGVKTEVFDSHLWAVWQSSKKKNRKTGNLSIEGILSLDIPESDKFDLLVSNRCSVLTTEDLYQRIKKDKNTTWNIPLCNPVVFSQPPGRWTNVPPYLLGVILGDGTVSEQGDVQWMKPDKHLVTRIEKEIQDHDLNWAVSRRSSEHTYGLKSQTATGPVENPDSPRRVFSRSGLSGKRAWEKFIPKQYLHAPIETRIALVQGLMDTDGYVDERGHVEFSSTSERLANDLSYLVRSLGCTANISHKPDNYYIDDKGNKVQGRPAWRVYIRGNTGLLFSLPRKADRLKPFNGGYSIAGRRITSIKKLKTGPGRCITVSHPNGLYLTNDFIVTHNSDALLMAALQYVNVPGYSAIVFRKTLSDLKLPGSLLDRAHSWLNGTPAKWMGSEHAYYFPTYDHAGNLCEPAKLVFGYIGQEGAKYRYQGAEFNFVAFDELTQHSEEDYTYLFSRLRRVKCVLHTEKDKKGNPIYHPQCPTCQSAARVPLRIRAASNPGGIGHLWVKERFAIQADILPSGKTRFIGRNPNRPYIPAFLIDNPHLDQEGYDSGLEELDPVTREQLRNGNWDISPDSRFKPHWFRRYSIRNQKFHLSPNGTGDGCYLHEFQRVFITADTAASTKEGPGDDKRYRLPNGGSWTVLAVWALTHDYNLLLLDIRRFRKEIPEIPKEVKALYRKWKPQEIVMEAIGTGKGAYQLCVKEGLPMRAIHPHNDKIVRSTDAQVRAEKGKIWLPCNPGPLWLKEYENELFTWSGHPYEVDDQVDVTSFAAQAISWEAAGGELGEADNQNVVVAQEGPSVVYAYGNFASGIWY
jgi:predicted phage terminase large subunit-like protein